MMFESAIQVYLDVPHLSASDVNGDGRPDIVASRGTSCAYSRTARRHQTRG